MTFAEWFSTHEWYKENSRREDFEALWNDLASCHIPPEQIAEYLDRAIWAVVGEYT